MFLSNAENSLYNLSEEILLVLMSFLSPKNLASFARVCKLFHALSVEELLWKEKIVKKWKLTKKPESETWRELFKRLDSHRTLWKGFAVQDDVVDEPPFEMRLDITGSAKEPRSNTPSNAKETTITGTCDWPTIGSTLSRTRVRGTFNRDKEVILTEVEQIQGDDGVLVVPAFYHMGCFGNTLLGSWYGSMPSINYTGQGSVLLTMTEATEDSSDIFEVGSMWKVFIARKYPCFSVYTFTIEERVNEKIQGSLIVNTKKFPVVGTVEGHHIQFQLHSTDGEDILWNVSDTPLQFFPIMFTGWRVGMDAIAIIIEDQNAIRCLALFILYGNRP